MLLKLEICELVRRFPQFPQEVEGVSFECYLNERLYDFAQTSYSMGLHHRQL